VAFVVFVACKVFGHRGFIGDFNAGTTVSTHATIVWATWATIVAIGTATIVEATVILSDKLWSTQSPDYGLLFFFCH
jgi:hypothetical protein